MEECPGHARARSASPWGLDGPRAAPCFWATHFAPQGSTTRGASQGRAGGEPVGAEQDADIVLDRVGSPRATGGMSATARDLARFGEMIRLNGRYNGRQIVPAGVVAKIRAGGSRELFGKAIWDYSTRRGFSYKSQWWITHNANGAFMGIGLHGQALYIDPRAEMVAVRFLSNPSGSTVDYDHITLPAFAALADHLIRTAPRRYSKSIR